MHTSPSLSALRNLPEFRKEAGEDVAYIDPQHLRRCVIWTAQHVVSIDNIFDFKLNVIVLQKVQRYCVDKSYSGGDVKGEVRKSSPGVLKSRSAFHLANRKSSPASRQPEHTPNAGPRQPTSTRFGLMKMSLGLHFCGISSP